MDLKKLTGVLHNNIYIYYEVIKLLRYSYTQLYLLHVMFFAHKFV